MVTLFGMAVDTELIERNPFRGLGRRTRGRSDERPPTEEELSELLDACAVHGWYEPQMRSLITFAAYTGILLVLSVYLQDGLGYPPLDAGFLLVPFAVGSAISSPIAGRIVSRLGRRVTVIALAAITRPRTPKRA